MVGGRLHTHRQLKALLLDDFGVALVATHWHTDRARMPYEIPTGIEVMLIITTCIGHELSNHARDLATKAGIPYVGISTKRTSWDRPFKNAGMFSPPRWRSSGDATEEPEAESSAVNPVRTSNANADPFGAVLSSARKAAGMTQQMLGDRIGVKGSTVSGWETGQQTPRFAYYRTMIDALPDLRQHAPPVALEGRTFETLAPSAEAIAEAAPTAPTLTRGDELGIAYVRARADAEACKRLAEEHMRFADEAMDGHKRAHERSLALLAEIDALASGKDIDR
jgi:transcriptional regulator with XRE-family HTH domain